MDYLAKMCARTQQKIHVGRGDESLKQIQKCSGNDPRHSGRTAFVVTCLACFDFAGISRGLYVGLRSGVQEMASRRPLLRFLSPVRPAEDMQKACGSTMHADMQVLPTSSCYAHSSSLPGLGPMPWAPRGVRPSGHSRRRLWAAGESRHVATKSAPVAAADRRYMWRQKKHMVQQAQHRIDAGCLRPVFERAEKTREGEQGEEAAE